jgi:hypothetical protein
MIAFDAIANFAAACEIDPMRSFVLLPVVLLLSGCGAMAKDKDWNAELRATAEKCGIPSEQLQFAEGSVRWIAPETTTYDQAKCVFDELKVRGIPTKQGYVSGGR